MNTPSIRHFPTRAELQRIRLLRENLIDLSVALDDARAEWLDAEATRLAALLDDARRELVTLLGRAA